VIHGDGRGSEVDPRAPAPAATMNRGPPLSGYPSRPRRRRAATSTEGDGRLRAPQPPRPGCAVTTLPGIVYIPCVPTRLLRTVDRIRREVIRHDIRRRWLSTRWAPGMRRSAGWRPMGRHPVLRRAPLELGPGSPAPRPCAKPLGRHRAPVSVPRSGAYAARLTWYAIARSGRTQGPTTIGLFPKKANTGPKPATASGIPDRTGAERIKHHPHRRSQTSRDFAAHCPGQVPDVQGRGLPPARKIERPDRDRAGRALDTIKEGPWTGTRRRAARCFVRSRGDDGASTATRDSLAMIGPIARAQGFPLRRVRRGWRTDTFKCVPWTVA
jgi:hypothetical protein